MAGSILQINDSTLATTLVNRDDSIIVEFAPALRVKSEGMPGVDASTLWEQTVRIHFTEAEFDGEAPAAAQKLKGGDITVNGLTYQDIIPLPLNAPGAAELELNGLNGEHWIITGTRVEVELVGTEKYIRHLDAC